ncbi:MAG: metal ABC transporter permease [Candidatus Methanomethylophilaceae archaeon]|nr:metal ABC transporter permease [Candidatus Methanomethylophilaceae archaeon]NLF34040.1 metal ABC transporter permease [Thermoplasmatales archaeon]
MTDWIYILSIPAVQNMFVATVIACVLCSVVGAFVVVNRMVSVTGGIAHSTFGGVGFAYYISSVLLVSWLTPMLGALVFGIAAALIMSVTNIKKSLRQDSVIGVLWAGGMALGVIFMSMVDRTVVTPLSYEAILFGDVLFVGADTLLIMAAVSAVVLAVVLLLFRELQILTFDDVHARLFGVNIKAMNIILYVIISVTCVMVSNVVGIIMIIALMTIPAAMANLFTYNLKDMMISAAVMSTVLSVLGLFVAIALDCPPGATVVLMLGVAFLSVLGARWAAARLGRGRLSGQGE